MELNKGEIVLSVSEYLERLNIALGQEAGFVQGEVIGFKESAQWVFFSLQDQDGGGVLSCGLLAHEYRRIGVRMEDGMTVKIFGNPRITPKSGRFGMWVKSIEPIGEGSLKKAYDLLLKKLTLEGLFARKRVLPEFISRIGVISSRDGVVLQDLRKNLRRLGIEISFVHTQVEGAGAVPGLLKALNYFANNYDKYDCVIVIRGGGSLESLQAFNNEEVVRAIYASPIPVIAGIGHDVDVPLAALVADREGSTPTAVAHIINATWDRLVVGLPNLQDNLLSLMADSIEDKRAKLGQRFEQMSRFIEKLKLTYHRLLSVFMSGVAKIDNELARVRDSVTRIDKLLTLVSPLRNLELGYSISLDKSGHVLRSVKGVKKGDRLTTRLSDGIIESEIK